MARYCPTGDGVFEEWVERCPDCGRTLSEKPPAGSETATDRADQHRVDSEPVVYLATAPNEPMAHLWRDVLRDEGIRSLAKAAGPGIGGWGTAFGMEHELFVLSSDLSRAREILAELERDDDQMAGTDDDLPF